MKRAVIRIDSHTNASSPLDEPRDDGKIWVPYDVIHAAFDLREGA